MEELNLQIIDEAFGPHSDLYQDVLGIKPSATPPQVERAYFDRRDELFRILSEMDQAPEDEKTTSYRMKAEQKMDAVVMTGRILSDPELRLHYDDLRSQRLHRSAKVAPTPERTSAGAPRIRSPEVSPIASAPPSKSSTTPDVHQRPIQPPTVHAKRSRRSPRKGGGTTSHPSSPGMNTTLDTTLNTTVDSEWTDDTTYTDEGTVETYDDSIVLHSRKQGMFARIKEEVVGVVDDTSQSFSQIFSVFTLRDDDIDAVTRKIHKAERQLVKKL